MSHKTTIKPLAIAIGAAFVTSLAVTPIANAAENPFAMSDLSDGYKVAEKAEGKCGSGMQGMDKSKMKGEGKCGESHKAESEGKCGGGKMGGMNKSKMESMNKAEKEGKCGEGKMKDMDKEKMKKEGKCGEAKCGGSK